MQLCAAAAGEGRRPARKIYECKPRKLLRAWTCLPRKKCNHLLLLNEQMFLFGNCDICEVLSCICCKAEVKCSMN